MSSFRPLEPSSLARLFALFEIRSMFSAVVVFIVLLVLAYMTNPSETSFRAFLTEQAFRHHLSRLDDTDTQDELELASPATRPDVRSRRGQSNFLKQRSTSAYASPPFPFASRASVSLRTPKHIFRSLGILSIAAVVSSPANRSLANRTQRVEGTARVDKNDGCSAYASLISDSWFIGAFGMWFWAANLNGLWRDAGIIAKDDVDGTVSGVLEVKALDRSDVPNCTSSTSNGNTNHSQRRGPKLRSRERFTHQNGHTHHRSQTPPPLPKSASLPLHTKGGAHLSTPEKSHHHLNDSIGSSLSITSSSPLVQPTLPVTTEARSIKPVSLPVPASTVTSPSASPARSPTSLFASSPLIAEILRQITASQTALSDFRTQLSDFHSTSASARAALNDELEKQRSRKRADDTSKTELKAQTKALEDQKRTAEGARRDAEKRLKAACTERDGVIARTERLEREMRELHVQMETQGAAIVASGVEAGALAADLEVEVEAKRAEIRGVEDEITQLAGRMREIEEKEIEEEQRLKCAYANAEARKHRQSESQEQNRSQRQDEKAFIPNGNGNVKVGTRHSLSLLQTRQMESKPSDRVDMFPPSPVAVSMPDSPLTVTPPEVQSRHTSSPVLPIPAPINSSRSFSIFDSDVNPLHAPGSSHSRTFAPFNEPATTELISPTSELLIPSSLFESLGMGGVTSGSPVSPVPAAGMDVSRSFQSEDDIILDRNWLNRRNGSAGDVGQPPVFPLRGSACSGADTSPVSPSDSVREFDPFDPFEMHLPVHERQSSLRMDTQRATFPARPYVSESADSRAALDDMFSAGSEHRETTTSTTARRSGWFTSSKDRDAKAREKGLNPDAKEFSLSKDKERSFSAFLSRSRGSGSGSAGSSSTPSTASLSTPESLSVFSTPASVSASVETVSPQAQTHRTTSSLLSLSSSWFGSSRAFAPTPMEREQLSLARVLGGSGNASLDRLPSLQTSPLPKPALPHAHSVTALPRLWDASEALGTKAGLGLDMPKMSFSPFADEEPFIGALSSSSPTDESAGTGTGRTFGGHDCA
ncbi:hypothetical protein DFH11DRAFT_1502066 [Phellopilus nigrolimitatus]|nr:hypothetical protein DFH11DRAFT_1502066 [Phellopilus nigrolimitatus]